MVDCINVISPEGTRDEALHATPCSQACSVMVPNAPGELWPTADHVGDSSKACAVGRQLHWVHARPGMWYYKA